MDALPVLRALLDGKDREHFVAVALNVRNQVIGTHIVSIGSLAASIVHPREIFAFAIERRAFSLILVHNHPSGDCTPSRDDVGLTRRLVQAGQIMGIEILDHIIVSDWGDGDFLSMKERGLL